MANSNTRVCLKLLWEIGWASIAKSLLTTQPVACCCRALKCIGSAVQFLDCFEESRYDVASPSPINNVRAHILSRLLRGRAPCIHAISSRRVVTSCMCLDLFSLVLLSVQQLRPSKHEHCSVNFKGLGESLDGYCCLLACNKVLTWSSKQVCLLSLGSSIAC